MNAREETTSTADREVVQERLVDASPERVFDAFADAKEITRWWGPRGFTTTTYEKEVRVGGLWRFTMHGPDGTDWPNWVRYTEVERPARLSYEHGGELDEPAHFLVFIDFIPEGGKTRLRMRSVFPTPEALEAVKKFGAIEGGKQTLDRLEEMLREGTGR